MTLFLSS